VNPQTTIATVGIGILVAEIYAWLPWFAERIVVAAALRLEEPARQRYLDDWRGELDARPGGVAKMIFAVEVFVTTDMLIEELPAPSEQEVEPSPTDSKSSSPPTLTLPAPALPSAAVSALQAPPRIRTLGAADANLVESLAVGTAAWEQDVAQATTELCQILQQGEAHTYEYEGRIAETHGSQTLVGLSVFSKRPLSDSQAFADAVYVALFDVNRPYRGCLLSDGVTPIDSLLLCDTFAQIERKWGRPAMPYIWTLVHRDHKEEPALLAKHGFWRVRNSQSDPDSPYDVYLRSNGLGWAHGFSPQIVESVGA
jgi:hypothetical protein